MDTKRKREIQKIAQDVSKTSEQFQLIHATYACQMIIKQIVMNDYIKKYDELASRIEEKMCAGVNYEKEQEEKEQLDMLIKQRSFHIDVAYIDTTSDDVARVVKIQNAFVINLSKSLAKNIFSEDGNYNYNIIHKIRELMSHELGLLILHTNELLQIDGTQGSKLITDPEKEEEADFFGNELLELRKMRNRKLYQDGGAHKIF